MPKCEFHQPKDKNSRKNCTGCKSRTGKVCKDEKVIQELYEESYKFNAIDRMMRGNRGISGPM